MNNMNTNMTDDEIWDIIGFLKISDSRYKTLKTLNTNRLMPTELAKAAELTNSQVSNALHDLKKKKLVRCMNEHARKGRVYEITPLGKEILETLKNSENI
nr:winged helix-turn-helix domain-containing protein [uncultured Methanobrevibacter sp.]